MSHISRESFDSLQISFYEIFVFEFEEHRAVDKIFYLRVSIDHLGSSSFSLD